MFQCYILDSCINIYIYLNIIYMLYLYVIYIYIYSIQSGCCLRTARKVQKTEPASAFDAVDEAVVKRAKEEGGEAEQTFEKILGGARS